MPFFRLILFRTEHKLFCFLLNIETEHVSPSTNTIIYSHSTRSLPQLPREHKFNFFIDFPFILL